MNLLATKRGVSGAVLGSSKLRASIPVSFVVKDVGNPSGKQVVTCVLGPNFTLGVKNCPDGQVMSGFDDEGTPLCGNAAPNLKCDTGQFLTGIETVGSQVKAVCANASSIFKGQSCGAKVLTGFNSDGSPICADSGSIPAGFGISPQWNNSSWTGNQYTCPDGFTLTYQHYDCHCSNNATWPTCIKNQN